MRFYFHLILLFTLSSIFSGASAQNQVPDPKSHFGFNIGDNYHLANYTQTEAYFKKVAQASDRVMLQSIGKTEEGREQYMLIVSTPENLSKIDQYNDISKQLALGEISDSQARELSKEGKAVVWIDGGLHSTETVATHQLIQTLYELTSRNDDENMNILENTIILLVHANPDGHELMGDWYMRESEPTKREMTRLPEMYQKYAGHDNNRDFFMFNLAETKNMGKVLFVDWIPQIVYNHHQRAPQGAVVVGPPYRDPFNYVYDPILVTSLDAVGAAMHTRLNVEDKPGYGQRGASRFSTWWNGGLRTSVYFHNQIGILTEIIGGPNPSTTPLIYDRILPSGHAPNPVHPQEWTFQKSIDYSVSLNYAVLNHAANTKQNLLYNAYKMGANAVAKGAEPTLSINPSQIEYIKEISKIDTTGIIPTKWYEELKKDKNRYDPVAYVIPADQEDFGTATKFANRLIQSGIQIQKANSDFQLQGKNYPAGSYLVSLSQAFRAHILDMFEPQHHPNDFEYPGGPPIPPYDASGWTLAFTMGIEFDRVTDKLPSNLPMATLERGQLIPLQGQATTDGRYIQLTPSVNDNFKAVNLLLNKNIKVQKDDQGNFYVKRSKNVDETLSELASTISLKTQPASSLPKGAQTIKPKRIAVWDNYGGTMKSGWMRFVLEDFNFDYSVIYSSEIDQGDLIKNYDLIIFAGTGIPAKLVKKKTNNNLGNIPEKYHNRVGNFSSDHSLPSLEQFIRDGGKVVLLAGSTSLAKHLGIPQKNPLTKNVNGKNIALKNTEYYIPGSVMNTKVNRSTPQTNGLNDYLSVYFDKSPVFTFSNEAIKEYNITPLLSFDSPNPMRSGWALGASHLENTIVTYTATLGNGSLFVSGIEPSFRAQTHGAYKLLFNQLY